MARQEQSGALVEWMQTVLAADRDVLAEIVRAGLQGLMEAERDTYVNAAPYERGSDRRAQRNGYRARRHRTRVGVLDLRVPRTRDGGFYPSLLERCQRSEGALIAALAECWIQGVSTRKVSKICEELFGERLSHETVSRYVARLDAELAPWRRRALTKTFPYLLVDARYEKARVDHRIVDVAVLVAIGVDEDGYRQVVGVDVALGETRTSWSEFLESLVERGLRGVRLIVSDAHPGLGDARRRHFPGVPWQRCQRHFLENALEKCPRALKDELHEALRAIWDESPDYAAARQGLDALVARLEPGHPELAAWLDAEGEESLTCFHFPAEHRLRIRTTNGNERINQELKRRTRVVRIFPHPASCLRLATALLKEFHEDWVTGRRYLRMEALDAAEAAPLPESEEVIAAVF